MEYAVYHINRSGLFCSTHSSKQDGGIVMPNLINETKPSHMLHACHTLGLFPSMLGGDEGEGLLMFRTSSSSTVTYRWTVKSMGDKQLSKLYVRMNSTSPWTYVYTTYMGDGEQYGALLNKSIRKGE